MAAFAGGVTSSYVWMASERNALQGLSVPSYQGALIVKRGVISSIDQGGQTFNLETHDEYTGEPARLILRFDTNTGITYADDDTGVSVKRNIQGLVSHSVRVRLSQQEGDLYASFIRADGVR